MSNARNQAFRLPIDTGKLVRLILLPHIGNVCVVIQKRWGATTKRSLLSITFVTALFPFINLFHIGGNMNKH